MASLSLVFAGWEGNAGVIPPGPKFQSTCISQVSQRLCGLQQLLLRGSATEEEVVIRLAQLEGECNSATTQGAFLACGRDLQKLIDYYANDQLHPDIPPEHVPDMGGTRYKCLFSLYQTSR